MAPMSELGQKRRFDRVPFASGLPLKTDISAAIFMSQTDPTRLCKKPPFVG
jgi:hypothetical protein